VAMDNPNNAQIEQKNNTKEDNNCAENNDSTIQE
jgi:hypothetical protein